MSNPITSPTTAAPTTAAPTTAAPTTAGQPVRPGGASSPEAAAPPPDATLPPGTDLAVRVRAMCKTYRVAGGQPRAAVADLDLDVARGEIVALLGPNGAGKSTATEVLEGHRQRDSGEVAVLGEDPWRAPLSWRAKVGIVLQDTSEPLELKVGELLAHWATLYPDPRPAAEVAELVGLGDRVRARVASLSGGQRRRLDVGLAIIGRPEVLFLDEPTTGFDPAARRQFWGVVEDLRDSGTTILLTTHYLDEAARLADRVAVIAGGRLVACDPPDDLGGAARDVTMVRWRGTDGVTRRESTSQPASLLRALLAEHAGPDGTGQVPELQVQRTSLEDVYLQLVGAHGADDEVAA